MDWCSFPLCSPSGDRTLISGDTWNRMVSEERGRGTVGVQWVRGIIDVLVDKASLTTGGEGGQGSEEGRGESVSKVDVVATVY